MQLWINVPSARKMDDPRYGTVPPSGLPTVVFDGGLLRVVAGTTRAPGAGGDGDERWIGGPFKTVQPIQIVDVELGARARYAHNVPAELDNCLVYVYNGGGQCAGADVAVGVVARVNAEETTAADRNVVLQAGDAGMHALIFVGKRLKQPIAWRGPFVMTTQEEINATIVEYQRGKFPPKRVPWNYRKLADFPKEQSSSK